MHTTFNFPIEYKSLNIDGDDFLIEIGRGDGKTMSRPVCAIIDPASEPNELHTVTLIGEFGGRSAAQWPSKITVVGDLKLFDNVNGKIVSAKGLTLERGTDTAWTDDSPQYTYSLSYDA